MKMPLPIISDHPDLKDIRVVSNDLSGKPGFTLLAVSRNELYYLPVFLKHYRNLGVERFIILDDRSDDGSRKWLAEQSDVMVLGSEKRYGDPVKPLPVEVSARAEYRMSMLWRQYLLDTFAIDTWCLLVDIDEFIVLPEHTDFPALAGSLDPENGEALWAIMLDTYPRHIRDLAASRSDTQLKLDGNWYFDGRPHLAFGSEGPKQIYHGSRSRLMTEHRLHRRPTSRAQARWYLRDMFRWRLQARPPYFNTLTKVPFVYWRKGNFLREIHSTDKPYYRDKLLPMLHFKFTGAIYDRVEYAINSKAYFRGSFEYHSLETLLETLEAWQAPMTSSVSRRVGSFRDFTETGNSFGLD